MNALHSVITIMLSLSALCSATGTDAATPPLSSTIENAGKQDAGKGVSDTLRLTARDMMTKIYGVLDISTPANEVAQAIKDYTSLPADYDDNAIWLDAEDGLVISYYGMAAPSYAMARYADGSISDFSYFILFPYSCGERNEADCRQCEFCGALLQEIHDAGAGMAASPDGVTATSGNGESKSLIFQTSGGYEGNLVEVSLHEEQMPDSSGQFMVVMSVAPNAYLAADDVFAQND